MPRSLMRENYRHCPLKKRPVVVIRDEPDDKEMEVSEPENLSTKPQDLSVRRVDSPVSPPPLVISTTPSPPPLTSLPPSPLSLPPMYLHKPPSSGVLEPLSLNTPVPTEQMSWPPIAQPRHLHHHQFSHHQHQHLPHQTNYLPYPSFGPVLIRRPPVSTVQLPQQALSRPRSLSPTLAQHRVYSSFMPTYPESTAELNLLSPSSSSASSGEIFGVEDLSRPAKGTANQKFSCQSCSKSYSSFSGLSKHRSLHCPASSVSLTSDDDNANNNNINAPPKSFSCKYCEKTYVSLGALKMHIRTHTLPCKCKLCGKAFSRPWLLQGHIRTHTGEKPFSCQHCCRAFADRSNLRAHLQTHSDVKKYSCQHCSKTFSRMSLLGKHLDGGCSGISQHSVDSIIMQQQQQMQLVH
ncbi:protein snail homolog Sna-like [Cloeon dipterum]|uniref:protein snail homolog Sna-like n=1 Tax=Cloeon dipterum TaxID=197152 RepID=UPI00321FE635